MNYLGVRLKEWSNTLTNIEPQNLTEEYFDFQIRILLCCHLPIILNNIYIMSCLVSWSVCILSTCIFQRKCFLTLPVLRLSSSKAHGRKGFRKPSKPCHIGIFWIVLGEFSQTRTHVPCRLKFSASFVLPKLATSSITVKTGIIKLV